MKNETNKPIHRIRRGAISASIFLNEARDGTKFPSVVITRSYKTEDGFKQASSYGGKDLLLLGDLVASLQVWLKANYPHTVEQR